MRSIVVREAHCSCVSPNVAAGVRRHCCLGHGYSSVRSALYTPAPISTRIELLQNLLHLLILLLHRYQRLLDSGQAQLLVGFVRRTSLVLQLAVVLDFLATVLDLRKTQGRRGAL
jgi:hypothetical protein